MPFKHRSISTHPGHGWSIKPADLGHGSASGNQFPSQALGLISTSSKQTHPLDTNFPFYHYKLPKNSTRTDIKNFNFPHSCIFPGSKSSRYWNQSPRHSFRVRTKPLFSHTGFIHPPLNIPSSESFFNLQNHPAPFDTKIPSLCLSVPCCTSQGGDSCHISSPQDITNPHNFWPSSFSTLWKCSVKKNTTLHSPFSLQLNFPCSPTFPLCGFWPYHSLLNS